MLGNLVGLYCTFTGEMQTMGYPVRSESCKCKSFKDIYLQIFFFLLINADQYTFSEENYYISYLRLFHPYNIVSYIQFSVISPFTCIGSLFSGVYYLNNLKNESIIYFG